MIRNNDIDSIAQSFSNKLSKKGGNLEFSNNKYKGEELGEITFYNELGEINIDSLIEYWYEDEKYFEYKNIYLIEIIILINIVMQRIKKQHLLLN